MNYLGNHPLTSPVSDRVYVLVRQSLRCGLYKPGQKITHRAVAAQLGVSVTPVREAITRLVSEESLSMPSPKTITAPRLRRSDLDEITKIRIRLEGWAAELATANTSASFISQLEELHMTYCTHRRSHEYNAKIAANARFHFSIYAQSKVPRLLAIIDNLWVTIGPTLGLLANLAFEDRDGEEFHAAAIAALKAGKAAAVRKAIIGDILTGYQKMLRFIETE